MELFHAPLFFVYFCRRIGDPIPSPTPNGSGAVENCLDALAQFRTVKKNGTHRDASLKSLSVTARRDACPASGTKATVTRATHMTHYLIKNND